MAALTPVGRATAPRRLRTAMGRFPTGVTVVTTTVGDAVHGMTANGVLSVSLDPPLVLVSLGRCRMAEVLPQSGRYGISVLAEDQEGLARHFAGLAALPEPPALTWAGGLPFVAGALATVGCRVVDLHPAGDHCLWIGQVDHLEHRDGRPLVFFAGQFGALR